MHVSDREFDANKHCGVMMEDIGKPCTRSLTCKVRKISVVFLFFLLPSHIVSSILEK